MSVIYELVQNFVNGVSFKKCKIIHFTVERETAFELRDMHTTQYTRGRLFEFTQFWIRLRQVWNRLILVNGIDSNKIYSRCK